MIHHFHFCIRVHSRLRCFFLFIAFCSIIVLPSLSQSSNGVISHGALIRTDTTVNRIHLVFTGHEFADGGETIRKVLSKHHVKASFFLTGDFYRTSAFSTVIAGLKKDGHDLGPHSDKHLLYCSWENRDSLLITRAEFKQDLEDNFAAMALHNIERTQIFLPPYEWYNDVIASWTEAEGIALVNFTSGTYSNADYTTPDMGVRYIPSDTIVARILRFESESHSGLNGFMLLMHIGVDPRRPDPLYKKLDSLLQTLKRRKYRFEPLSTVITPN